MNSESSVVDCGSSPTEDTSSSSAAVTTTSSSAAVTVMDRLQAPPPSELSRKRKIHTNPPPKGKRRSSSRGYCDPKSVNPTQRVREFPDEELTISAINLFCKACRECVGLKRSIVLNHVKSVKHAESKKRLLGKEASERDIAVAMKQHDDDTHRKGGDIAGGAACLSGTSHDGIFASRSILLR